MSAADITVTVVEAIHRIRSGLNAGGRWPGERASDSLAFP
jgi:hypothetical protein